MRSDHRVYLHGWGFHHSVFSNCPDYAHSAAPCLYELARQAGDYSCAGIAASLRDRLKQNSVLIGWSLGGQVALQLAAQSNSISALVLIASAPLMVNTNEWTHAIDRSEFDRLRQGFVEQPEKTLKRIVALTAAGDERPGQCSRTLLRHVADLAQQDVLECLLGEMASNDLRPVFDRLQIPLLMILGKNDVLIHAEAAQVLAASNVTTEIMPDCGHAPFIHHALQVQTIIESFLKNIDG